MESSFIKNKKMILRIVWMESTHYTVENIILEGVYNNEETVFLTSLTKEEAENITGKTKEELIGKVCILELYSEVKRILKINKKLLSFYMPLIKK